MLVMEVQAYGGPESIVAVQRPQPEPVTGRVRVRVRAVTVNPVDLMTRAGALASMTPELKAPFVLGWDLAGELIDATEELPAGQKVIGMIPWLAAGTGEGAYAEVVLVDPAWLAPLPDGVEFAAAATLPLNSLTAAQALDRVKVQADSTVLITGATGAVGAFAVQEAVARGARVFAVASTGDDDFVASLGAEVVLSRTTPEELIAAVRRLAPEGVDAVVDAASLGQGILGAARDGGDYVGVVFPAQPNPERDVSVSTISVVPDSDALRRTAADLAAGRLITRIAQVLPATEAAQAHQIGSANGLRGKLVLTFE